MSPQIDPQTGEMATAAPGPGRFEWGTLSFQKPPYTSGTARPVLEVEIDDQDGSVVVAWDEPADDYWGTGRRVAYFSAEEFDQIIATRVAARERSRS